VTTHQTEAPVANQRPGDPATERVWTKLVLQVSNYHFNRSALGVAQRFVCKPTDCKITIKFSSTSFAPKKVGGGPAVDDVPDVYYFDKGGFCTNYATFVALLTAAQKPESDPDLDHFWTSVVANYKASTGVALDTIETGIPRRSTKAAAASSKKKTSKKEKSAAGKTTAKRRKTDGGGSDDDNNDGAGENDDDDDDGNDNDDNDNGVGEDAGDDDDNSGHGDGHDIRVDGPFRAPNPPTPSNRAAKK